MHEPERRIKAKECEYTFDDKESTFHLVVLLTQGIRLVDVVGRDEKALSASGTTLPKGNMRQAGQWSFLFKMNQLYVISYQVPHAKVS